MLDFLSGDSPPSLCEDPWFGGPPRLSHADAIAFVHGGLRGVQLQKLSLAAEEVHTSIITQGVVLGSWSLTRGGW